MLVFVASESKHLHANIPRCNDENATHNIWRACLADYSPRREPRMTLGERLKLVRGTTSQKAFASELRVHENTVSNAERRDSATQEFLLRIADARGINLHWLLTGHGAIRVAEDHTSLFREKLSLALADALRVAYGPRHAAMSLDTRARALRAATSYLLAIGVTEDNLPDVDTLARFVKLTLDVLRRAS
jgi:transcriptional regulator with XRE-family HTH domain